MSEHQETYLSDISQCIESHTRKSNVSSRSLLQNIDLFCRALLQKRPITYLSDISQCIESHTRKSLILQILLPARLTHTHAHTQTHTHTQKHTHTRTIEIKYLHTHTYTHTHQSYCARPHTHTHTHQRSNTRKHTHTRTHTSAATAVTATARKIVLRRHIGFFGGNIGIFCRKHSPAMHRSDLIRHR